MAQNKGYMYRWDRAWGAHGIGGAVKPVVCNNHRNIDYTAMNYLKVLIAGEKAISSTEVMHRYQISSTTSISRSKAALIKNDILDNKAGEISFQDPIYAYWLKTEYFAK